MESIIVPVFVRGTILHVRVRHEEPVAALAARTQVVAIVNRVRRQHRVCHWQAPPRRLLTRVLDMPARCASVVADRSA